MREHSCARRTMCFDVTFVKFKKRSLQTPSIDLIVNAYIFIIPKYNAFYLGRNLYEPYFARLYLLSTYQ